MGPLVYSPNNMPSWERTRPPSWNPPSWGAILSGLGVPGLLVRALRTDPFDLVRISQPFSPQEVDGYLGLNMKLCLSPGFEPGSSDRKAYC